jgi:hypothetical protein
MEDTIGLIVVAALLLVPIWKACGSVMSRISREIGRLG